MRRRRTESPFGGERPIGDPHPPPSLDELSAKLAAANKAREKPVDEPRGHRQMGAAYRVLVEMAAGVGVGAGLGWLVDSWLGTRPWLMLVLVVLGFAAGIRNVLREGNRLTNEGDKPGKDER